jgi:hypothetical protein
LRHEKGVRAGAGSGVHRLEVGKPLPFKPEEERKHGGKVEGEKSHHKLGRKRGGSVHSGPGTHGTDATPDRGMKYGTPLQETKMSGRGNIEDSISSKAHRADGGKIDWIKKAVLKHPGAEKRAAKKAGESTHNYMESHKHDSGKSGDRARLGLRLSAMSKHKS